MRRGKGCLHVRYFKGFSALINMTGHLLNSSVAPAAPAQYSQLQQQQKMFCPVRVFVSLQCGLLIRESQLSYCQSGGLHQLLLSDWTQVLHCSLGSWQYCQQADEGILQCHGVSYFHKIKPPLASHPCLARRWNSLQLTFLGDQRETKWVAMITWFFQNS